MCDVTDSYVRHDSLIETQALNPGSKLSSAGSVGSGMNTQGSFCEYIGLFVNMSRAFWLEEMWRKLIISGFCWLQYECHVLIVGE